MPNGMSEEAQSRGHAVWEGAPCKGALYPIVRPAAHVCLCGESPLTAREGEGLATRQSQGGNKLMKEADSK